MSPTTATRPTWSTRLRRSISIEDVVGTVLLLTAILMWGAWAGADGDPDDPEASAGHSRAASPRDGEPDEAQLDGFAWLEGTWIATERPGQTREEIWSAPRGGTIVGTGRTVRGDRTTFIEFLTIEADEEGAIVYRALLGHRDPRAAAFRLVQAGDGRAVFEDPENDMPRRVTYERLSPADGAPDAPARMRVLLEGESRGEAIRYPIDFVRSSAGAATSAAE
jgi:hypothetical protein